MLKVDPKTMTLLDAVKVLRDKVAEWERSGEDNYPQYLIDVFNSVGAHCLSGFPPDDQMDLFLATIEFAKQWNEVYIHGTVNDIGNPLAAFRASLSALLDAIKVAEIPESPEIEPVHELLIQMEGFAQKYQQIANLYGVYDEDADRYTGPFHDGNGRVRDDWIREEARNPGSRIPKDWIPPGRARRREDARAISVQKLNELKDEMDIDSDSDELGDSASVESMLRERQFPDVIARVKGIPEEEVRAMAAELEIEIEEREEMLSREADNPEHQGRIDQQAAVSTINADALRDVLLDVFTDNNEVTLQEAMVLLSEKGLTASSDVVRGILDNIKSQVSE